MHLHLRVIHFDLAQSHFFNIVCLMCSRLPRLSAVSHSEQSIWFPSFVVVIFHPDSVYMGFWISEYVAAELTFNTAEILLQCRWIADVDCSWLFETTVLNHIFSRITVKTSSLSSALQKLFRSSVDKQDENFLQYSTLMNFAKNLTNLLRSPRIRNRFKCQNEEVYRGSYKGVFQTAEKS